MAELIAYEARCDAGRLQLVPYRPPVRARPVADHAAVRVPTRAHRHSARHTLRLVQRPVQLQLQITVGSPRIFNCNASGPLKAQSLISIFNSKPSLKIKFMLSFC